MHIIIFSICVIVTLAFASYIAITRCNFNNVDIDEQLFITILIVISALLWPITVPFTLIFLMLKRAAQLYSRRK